MPFTQIRSSYRNSMHIPENFLSPISLYSDSFCSDNAQIAFLETVAMPLRGICQIELLF